MSDAPLRIHVVCTGNICRSAFAAEYLRSGLEAAHPGRFVVTSSGTGWFDDLVVPEELHLAARGYGISLDHHVGRYAVPAHYRAADLILTATRDHRRQVLADVPAAMKRTFTILEFADLLVATGAYGGSDPDRWRDLIREVASARPRVSAADVPDPYRRPQAAFDEMASILVAALDIVIERSGRPPTVA